MSRQRSPVIAAIIAMVLLPNSSDAMAALGDDDDEQFILRLIALDITPNQCLQLRWLVWFATLQPAVKGAPVKARCRVAIEKCAFGDRSPPSAMNQAWDGRSGVGELARRVAKKMTAAEKLHIINSLLPFVPPPP